MTEDGFVPGCQEVFDSKTNDADYHNEMNSQHFEGWTDNVIENKPDNPNGVEMIMDNASYHTRKLMAHPTKRLTETRDANLAV